MIGYIKAVIFFEGLTATSGRNLAPIRPHSPPHRLATITDGVAGWLPGPTAASRRLAVSGVRRAAAGLRPRGRTGVATSRHLQFVTYRTRGLRGSTVPTTACTGAPAWAERHARFTLLFERLAIDVLKECDIRGATRILRISWDEAWHLMERAVPGASARRRRACRGGWASTKRPPPRGPVSTLVCDLTQPGANSTTFATSSPRDHNRWGRGLASGSHRRQPSTCASASCFQAVGGSTARTPPVPPPR